MLSEFSCYFTASTRAASDIHHGVSTDGTTGLGGEHPGVRTQTLRSTGTMNTCGLLRPMRFLAWRITSIAARVHIVYSINGCLSYKRALDEQFCFPGCEYGRRPAD